MEKIMNLDQLTEILKWMSIINMSIFVLSALLIMSFRKIICTLHSNLFGINEEKISIILYAYLGIYKIILIVFNIVPYLALLITN